MPLSEAEVDELLQNLKLDENNNCRKENIIEVSSHQTKKQHLSYDSTLQLFTQ